MSYTLASMRLIRFHIVFDNAERYREQCMYHSAGNGFVQDTIPHLLYYCSTFTRGRKRKTVCTETETRRYILHQMNKDVCARFYFENLNNCGTNHTYTSPIYSPTVLHKLELHSATSSCLKQLLTTLITEEKTLHFGTMVVTSGTVSNRIKDCFWTLIKTTHNSLDRPQYIKCTVRGSV